MEDKRKFGATESLITVPAADVQANYDALQKTLEVLEKSKRCIISIVRDSEVVHFAVVFIGNHESPVR
jgi:hypothetical protein